MSFKGVSLLLCKKESKNESSKKYIIFPKQDTMYQHQINWIKLPGQARDSKNLIKNGKQKINSELFLFANTIYN